jgi:RHH-type proline utilization regulon transcriptional repressor/proline dehydrogenase/delta 1-pyrroline-5-carboxylate dehydrogenase
MPERDLHKLLQKISSQANCNEEQHVQMLLDYFKPSKQERGEIQKRALEYANVIRRTKISGMEAFMHKYSLSTAEGVAIMCLAEALLRIPDRTTAIDLIEDKLKSKDFYKFIGQSDSLFVNASSWGLLLTGKIVDLSDSSFSINKLIAKLGENVVLQGMKQAVHLISDQFIMGNDMPEALKRAEDVKKKGYTMSYDILGESSRTEEQANKYYQQYLEAIDLIAKVNDPKAGLYDKDNISVKLSALHPKLLSVKRDDLKKRLLPRVVEIVRKCKQAGISVSFDAEEAFRQDIYLHVLLDLLLQQDFYDFDGIGFVVQAYSKRAFYIIDFIAKFGNENNRRIPVRLVKGAYWDTEIKHAQMEGLEDYPVFTRKEYTDVSYMACARKILDNSDVILPQFATHNAHTVAAIEVMAGKVPFEFQKLHGMGNQLYDHVHGKVGRNCRIYCPVGNYKDLLAYLMRRLLENGANTSFVNLIAEKDIALEEIIKDPLEATKESLEKKERSVILPKDIFGKRRNSDGLEVGYQDHLDLIADKMKSHMKTQYDVSSIIGGKSVRMSAKSCHEVLSPFDHSLKVGKLCFASAEQMQEATKLAAGAFKTWSATPVEDRAQALENYADLLEKHKFMFYALAMREAGKTLHDCISEVREAIDFARYYAAQARQLMGPEGKLTMPGYTGEENTLSWHPKGVFVCISPWNFPLAIFSGQILAALVTGNTVIAKPAENTSIIGVKAVELMHQAGIPADALHVLVAHGREVSDNILTDNCISGVCFTGSTATAQVINNVLNARKGGALATLIAETGGQNAMIVDSSALLEQATDDIVLSAFGSAGQRCSALRVLYIQEEIYDSLLNMIKGAVDEFDMGNPTDFVTDIGPVIDARAQKGLLDHASNMKKLGFNIAHIHKSHKDKAYERGTFVFPHTIEVNSIADIEKENFGPILHVCKFKLKDLDKVIDDINATGFGLTFGVHSRIESRYKYIASRIHAGNIYINRSMTGAIVESQSFGGEGLSGTGFKAGGPNYLRRFMVERLVSVNTTAIGGNISLLLKK